MNQCALRISLNYRWLYIKCVCLFSIEIQTAGRIRMKFGTEVVFEGERLLGGGGGPSYPPQPQGKGGINGVQGTSGASAMHFGKNFIKQKSQGTSNLVRVGHPKSGSGRTWAPCPSGAMVTHYEGKFIKSKL